MTTIRVWLVTELNGYLTSKPSLSMYVRGEDVTDSEGAREGILLATCTIPGLSTEDWVAEDALTWGVDPVEYGLPTRDAPRGDRPDYRGFAKAVRPAAEELLRNSFDTVFAPALILGVLNTYASALHLQRTGNAEDVETADRALRIYRRSGVELPDTLTWGTRSINRDSAYHEARKRITISGLTPVEGVEDLYRAEMTIQPAGS